jgi:8-oxo-dGTP pyrophosphatase MutT (NUDIX family)
MGKEKPGFGAENGKEKISRAGGFPYRRRPDGEFEFLLITNKHGKWIFPKGKIEKGKTPQETFAHEAHEEAGILGKIEENPVGTYRHSAKKGSVQMHRMEVLRQLEAWDEDDDRERRWCTAAEVRQLVTKDALLELFEEALAGLLAK